MFTIPSDNENYVYGMCKASDLDSINIVCAVKKYEAGKSVSRF